MKATKLTKQERMIPQYAVRALNAAQERAKRSGVALVQVIGNDLCRIEPDGTRTVLKTLPPRTKVTVRTKRAASA